MDYREERMKTAGTGTWGKTWLSLEPEKEVQSPGQNQLGVMENKVQGGR